jgi:hypothetical protein
MMTISTNWQGVFIALLLIIMFFGLGIACAPPDGVLSESSGQVVELQGLNGWNKLADALYVYRGPDVECYMNIRVGYAECFK